MNGTGLCGLSPLWPGPAGPAPPGAAHRASAVMCATTDHHRCNAPC